MSAEGQTYVEKNSPFEGATYAVHLRLGLLSNDANHYRIWCGDQYLADKCRVSVRSVKRAKAILISRGYLKSLSPAVGRKVAEYQFLFRGQIIGGQGDPLAMGGQPVTNRGPNLHSLPINTNEMKESENPSISVPMPPGFRDIFKSCDSVA
jgi:hypothetical protein